MKLLIIAMIMSSFAAHAGTEASKWLCHSLISVNGEEISHTDILDSDDQRVLSAENTSYALTIEATSESIELRAHEKFSSKTQILQISSTNRRNDSSARLVYPLANGLLSIGCDKVSDESQSNKDRLSIKDPEKYNRSPAVDQLYIKGIMNRTLQQ